MVWGGWTSTSAHRGLRKTTDGGWAVYVVKRRGLRAGLERARSAIVGGTQVSIEAAPWQVGLIGEIPVEYEGKKGVLTELCGGVILSESRVLTAAHCMFDPVTGLQAPAEDFHVVAGGSDLAYDESTEQHSEGASMRVHPYFNYAGGPGTPDDVAILRLAEPLSLTGPAVRSIVVVPANSTPSAGMQVDLSGFGEQNPNTEELNGGLYSIGMTLGSSERCGGDADAVFLCASAPAGSACSGDSGGGLTATSATLTLIGILSTVEVVSKEACRDGAINGFVNLAAPEIRDFIEGDEAPRRHRGAAAA